MRVPVVVETVLLLGLYCNCCNNLIRSIGAMMVRDMAPAPAPATASRHWGTGGRCGGGGGGNGIGCIAGVLVLLWMIPSLSLLLIMEPLIIRKMYFDSWVQCAKL